MANLPTGAHSQQQKGAPDSIFYQFSPEETKVMNECNRESFFQRSLPFSVIAGAGAYMAVNAGYLKRNLKWGPWPKVIFGGMFGYILGKYSYQTICAERLMELPNSEIGRVLRERRGKSNGELFKGNIMTPVITPGTSDTDNNSSYSADYKSNINIDMHKPMNSIDIDYRPNYDDLSHNKTNETPSYDSTISYDDLRARNRFEFERTQPNKPVYRPPPPSNSAPIWDNQPYPPSEQIRNPQPRESRNQYGDVFNN